MDDKLKEYIQCLIENVGLNATRHKNQELAMKEAKEVMEKIVKNCSIPDVSQRYTIEDIERCVENWGLCKVEKEHIERFLNGG